MRTWLKEIKLEKYADALMDNGCDDLKELQFVNDLEKVKGCCKSISMPEFHIERLLRAIHEKRASTEVAWSAHLLVATLGEGGGSLDQQCAYSSSSGIGDEQPSSSSGIVDEQPPSKPVNYSAVFPHVSTQKAVMLVASPDEGLSPQAKRP